MAGKPETLYQKIVDTHTVKRIDDSTILLYVDIHFANEYTSPQAFAGLVERGIGVLSPDSHLCVVDHVIPTEDVTPPALLRTQRAPVRRRSLARTAGSSASRLSMARTILIRVSSMC